MIYFIIIFGIIIITSMAVAVHAVYKIYKDYPDDGGYN